MCYCFSNQDTIGILQLCIGFLGLGGVIVTLLYTQNQADKNDKIMNEHILSLHRQLTIIRAVLLIGKTQGPEQDRLCTLVEQTDKDLQKYISKKNTSDNK